MSSMMAGSHDQTRRGVVAANAEHSPLHGDLRRLAASFDQIVCALQQRGATLAAATVALQRREAQITRMVETVAERLDDLDQESRFGFRDGMDQPRAGAADTRVAHATDAPAWRRGASADDHPPTARYDSSAAHDDAPSYGLALARERVGLLASGRAAGADDNPRASGSIARGQTGAAAGIDAAPARAEANRRDQILTDPLTGLPNRACFLQSLDYALVEAAARGGGIAVLAIDLDRFGVTNDTLGSGVGDALLVTAAKRLGACLRPGDLLARLGDDEFAVLLQNVDDEQTVLSVAERLVAAIKQPVMVADRELATSASAGVALHVAPVEASAGDLRREAALALRQAKDTPVARAPCFSRRR